MTFYSDNSKVRLEGKCVAITGANTGIGKSTAFDLYCRGAKVLMLCRNLQRATEAAQDIRTEAGENKGNGEINIYIVDLASMESIREAAKKLLEAEPLIDILVNNAGVVTWERMETEDGLELHMGINHFGHFLLTELLMPALKRAAADRGQARIVIVSSMVSQFGFARIKWDDINSKENFSNRQAYSMSKLANILHANALARKLNGTGITVYSVHPGMIKTDLGRSLPKMFLMFAQLFSCFIKSPKEGCQTTLYCCLEESIKDDTGKYYDKCAAKTPKDFCLDEEDQERLWSLSQDLMGLTKKNHD